MALTSTTPISALSAARWRSPGAPGPFALSAPDVMEAALREAGPRLLDSGETPIAVEYPDAEAACRVMLPGSARLRAVQSSGEDRVRQVILNEIAPYQAESGSYRFQNRFRLLIATRSVWVLDYNERPCSGFTGQDPNAALCRTPRPDAALGRRCRSLRPGQEGHLR